jgi:hypothetical protein
MRFCFLLEEVDIIRGSNAIRSEPAAGRKSAAIDRGFMKLFWV